MAEMVTLAFTISSYRLCDFVHLGLKQLRKLTPESPILVSDDVSPESRGIASHASQHCAQYLPTRIRKGHFSGDFQSLVNALVFAESQGADVAVKVSQRFIFRKPESIDVIRKTFSDPNIMVATPGQMSYVNGHASKASRSFALFSILSDVVMIRVGSISAQELLEMYRHRLRTETVQWAAFIEAAVDDLHSRKFPGRTAKIQELTNPVDPADPIYLRRHQHSSEDYKNLGSEHGIGGAFDCREWGAIELRRYLCKPRVV